MKKKISMFDQLPELFFATRQIIRQQLRDSGGRHDLHAWLRFETLRFVEQSSEPTMRDIARHLRIQAPSATSLVRNLIRRKLVARRKGKDRRVVRIALTAQGARELSAYRVHSVTTMRRVFSKLNRSDVEELVRVLRSVQDAH